ncbi:MULTISPECIES: YbfB/YjiJ family MFS transporter [Paraburkholderia]|uniref:YbfB/YjiJ family MFS transporter n=1 Tax=Paraburkholderia TaxID=1822464 RepID=UPI0022552627|nr:MULTISPECIES: YbfB/YjiJ family MFS transporter [Paraburkholderia]MCX4163024.1 YbfB/YjiJ family MFS transporter [Paraburkholderia megapolitana]MDN7158520.1 YbfB/YjiJ family MFS transporter [Paraburkholderia sp. CHISQ3]MDQ6495567.1 YbfB/YjiJ family MFS transporter [Paraburkholderia megapolitana]
MSEKTHSSSVSRAGQADFSTADAALTPLWVVVGLAMGPAVALGLSRFAYALLLPLMRSGLGWSFADAGAMNTANAAGYLAGALITAPLGRWIGNKRVFAIGLLLTALCVGATGLTSHFTLLLVLRTLTGVTGALAFVAGAGLTSAAAAGGSKSRAPTVLGVYFAGAGLGVMASALTIPPLLSATGWRGGWLALGGLSLLATIYGWLVLSRTPEPAHHATRARGGWSVKFMVCKLLSYCLYGAGYITYATFIVAYLRSNVGFNSYGITTFWSVLGLAAIVAAFAWGPVLGHLKGGWGTAATVAMVAVGAVLPLTWPTAAGAYLSAILFGGSFLAVVAAVTSFARRAAQPHAWTAAIAALTVAFGVGQCIGPILSGALSDGPSGIRAGLWLSVGILTLSVVAAAFQREPEAS